MQIELDRSRQSSIASRNPTRGADREEDCCDDAHVRLPHAAGTGCEAEAKPGVETEHFMNIVARAVDRAETRRREPGSVARAEEAP